MAQYEESGYDQYEFEAEPQVVRSRPKYAPPATQLTATGEPVMGVPDEDV